MASSTDGDAAPVAAGVDHASRIPALAPGHVIAGGHALAAAALTAMCVAAAGGSGGPADARRLPGYAGTFFALTAASRLVLFRERRAATATPHAAHAPVRMSLGAAAQFVSNAAVSVATLVRPDRVLALTAYAALDVIAHWLEMVAAALAPAPVHPRLLGPRLVLDLAADVYIYALIAGYLQLDRVALPGFVLKAACDVCLVYLSAKTVVLRDAKKRDDQLKTD